MEEAWAILAENRVRLDAMAEAFHDRGITPVAEDERVVQPLEEDIDAILADIDRMVTARKVRRAALRNGGRPALSVIDGGAA